MPRALAVCLVVLLTTACGPHVPHYPDLAGRDLYACCNLRFNQSRYASDANYAYARGGTTVPVGTRIRVSDDAEDEVHLLPEGQNRPFELAFKFGKSRMNSHQYFRTVLLESDPREALRDAPAAVAAAITDGRLVEGMTKPQAILARGYPPLHRTAGWDADQWTYYVDPELVDIVEFVDGRIARISRTSSPTR